MIGAIGMETRDQPNLAPLMKETICWTEQLDTIFLSHTAHLKAHSAFVGSTTGDLPGMYFGDDSLGTFRRFPAIYRAGCGKYDPRVRPWYCLLTTLCTDRFHLNARIPLDCCVKMTDDAPVLIHV